MADDKPVSQASRKKADSKKSVAGAKKLAKQALRSAKGKSVVVSKASARKPVSIKKARVGKRAVLPPLPPPLTVLFKARNPVRRGSSPKTLLRNKGAVKAGQTDCEVAICTEARLREKLRLAAPYIEIWLSRRDRETNDAPTPEAAFVRIWQWLTLETMLEDRRIVTADLIEALFAEEVRGERS
jgi:hypothetical protein